jgi:hypothetical protein
MILTKNANNSFSRVKVCFLIILCAHSAATETSPRIPNNALDVEDGLSNNFALSAEEQDAFPLTKKKKAVGIAGQFLTQNRLKP